MRLAFDLSAVNLAVIGILLGSAPSEIGKSIVEPVPIQVPTLLASLGQANKRLQHKSVNPLGCWATISH